MLFSPLSFCKNFRLGVRVFNSEKIGIEDPSPNPDFLFIFRDLKTRPSIPIFYLQNLCFPIVFTNGLDQIHLLVAVLGLK